MFIPYNLNIRRYEFGDIEMTVGELEKLLAKIKDKSKKILIEKLDINGDPVRGHRCWDVDRTEELKQTFAMGIHL